MSKRDLLHTSLKFPFYVASRYIDRIQDFREI